MHYKKSKRPRRRREAQPPPADCTVVGCTNKPSERKPYCIEHLDNLAYAKTLLDMGEVREKEELAALKSSRKIDPAGSRSKDILVCLVLKGAISPKRLAIMVEMQALAIENYLKKLEKVGYLENKTVGSRRGTPRRVILITEKGRKFIEPDLVSD